jgi:dienelactone hydrolase
MPEIFLALLLAATLSDPGPLRKKISDNFFIPNPLPALDTRVHGQFEPEPGMVADRISYSTELGMLVPAIVYHPKDTSVKRPAFIVVNGHGGDKYSWYAQYTGLLYARAGAVVLTYDPAGEGERNKEKKSGSRQHDIYQPPDQMGQRMAGLMITDIEQAVSYLAARPDVDRNRIAAGGYSMGSFILDLACAVETRLHACVAVGGGYLDGPEGYWDSSSKKMCQQIPYRSLSFLGDRGPVIFALQATHAKTFIFNGREDTVIAIPSHGDKFFEDLHQRTVALHGSAAGVFEYGFNPTGSHRPWFVTKPVGIWLEKQLHFPNWTEAKVEAMPVTHISEWAKANDVLVDKAYATEDREGGAMALDRNIPPVKRGELNVFSDSDWELQRDKLVLDTWWTKAKALCP